MSKRLTEDQIKWILSIEATEAQQEIRKLTKENRELEKANKDRRQEMIRLEMQGKKDSNAWKNLNAVVTENNQKLRTNQDMIRELGKTMSISELTMGQLRKRAQDLQRQMDNTSKSLNPEEYAKLDKELGAVRGRMTELRDESKKMGSLITSRGAIATFLGNIYTKGLQLITKGIQKAKEFISTSSEIAAQAQGIDHAFNRIANKDYLKSLREQTKGLISDFTLMQSAVRAENFNISLNQLGRLLEFAQNRARDTGESVDYLVESIVNGIGRKSPLILDNLGISAVRLQEEVKKTGDFAAAVGKIVEEEMAKAGPAIDTATDSATRKKVAWDNLMLSTGRFFVKFRSGWDDFVTRFANGITKMLPDHRSLTERFDDQINKVATLRAELPSLLDRYEELRTKTTLNKNEQSELNDIISKVVDVLPSAAIEFDKYGNVLSINTQKVRDFIAAEQAKLEIMNQDTISEQTKNLKKYEEQLDQLVKKRESGEGTRFIQTSSFGTSEAITFKYSEDELKEFDLQIAGLRKKILGTQEYLNDLTGKSVENRLQVRENEVKKEAEFNDMSKEQLKSYIEEYREQSNEFIHIAQRVYNHRFGSGEEAPDENEIKKRIDKRIKAEELALQKELSSLKQQLVEKEITRAEHDRLVEQKTIESLNKRLDIQSIEANKRAEIEQRITDFKIKALEQEKQFAKEREKIEAEFQMAIMTTDERELQSIKNKHAERLKELKEQLDKELITETQFNEYKAIILEEQDKELEEQQNIQREAKAARVLAAQSEELEREKIALSEKYAAGLISREAYNQALLELDMQYAQQSLLIENLSSEQRKKVQEKLLDFMIKKQDTETKKQETEQKKRAALYSQFGEEIGTLLGGVISGNEDLVHSSLKAILNMALDALEAQITMAIASATAQSFAQADSVATFGASGAARAAVLTALIKAAFAGVKAIVNSSLSGSKKSGINNSSNSPSSGARVITGRESGGYVDVNRAQDGKYFRALMKPKKRGFVDQPTVIVGDGPVGKSREWVASNDALENPTVAPIIKLLNEAQQAGNIRTIDLNHIMRTRMAGFAFGGFLYDNPLADSMRKSGSTDSTLYRQNDGAIYMELIRDTKSLLSELKREGIPSYMVFSEYQKKKDLIEKSQNIGSK